MSLIGVPLRLGDTGPNVEELHRRLLALGLTLFSTDYSDGRFGNWTNIAVREVRRRYGLSDVTDLPFDASVDRLLNVAAAAQGGNSRVLRDAVRESFSAANNPSEAEIASLATYATVARDFTTARKVVALVSNNPDIVGKVAPVVSSSTFQPAQPEIQNPESYYTCRYDYVPQQVLDELLGRPTAGLRSRLRFARRPAPRDGEADWPEVPNSVADHELPPPLPSDDPRKADLRDAALSWVNAVDLWQRGNREFKQQRYANAVTSYNACENAILLYFGKVYRISPPLNFDSIIDYKLGIGFSTVLWDKIHRRRVSLSLQELQMMDWSGFSVEAESLLQKNLGMPSADPEDSAPEFLVRQHVLDNFAFLLVAIFVPLARSEANGLRRFFTLAFADLQRVLTPYSASGYLGEFGEFFYQADIQLTCDFIERPFVKLSLGQTLLKQAETEYKSQTPAVDAPQEVYDKYHGMEAAHTYLKIFDLYADESAYVTRVQNGRDRLAKAVSDQTASGSVESSTFKILGKDVTLAGISSQTNELPGLARTKAPTKSWLKTSDTVDGEVVSETNPLVYALLLTAQARLEQLAHEFNYLGYKDDYVPPWRFQFLLERARYFAEHAKNAQRDHLNFLGNAEREQFQELSITQNVEMEKSNVRIETARVDQASAEVAVAQKSKELAGLTETNAKKRLDNYKHFDDYADDLFNTQGLGAFGGLDTLLENSPAPAITQVVTGVFDFVTGGAISRRREALLADRQREVEKFNLSLAQTEAIKAKEVAQAHLDTAQAGLVVAGLQRQAALLRHEFAVQNLNFLSNRVLSSEQWYRLAAAIRNVSETYLRYGIELAFLAEQAYEFEADKRINVIRFDYDISEVGEYLAADFLIRDLDTLEQDLLVTQRQRQQPVRYVLSMAREFPEALQEIRDSGKTTFSLRLEQIEKRFPGLYNVRIGAVDVLPVALMDPTRFSLEFSHLGVSQVRLQAQPDTSGTPSASPLNTNDLPVPAGGWLAELQQTWPIKLRVTGPETAIFSGLTQQDANAVFPFATTSQRRAFEALGAAAAWQVDLTARENQVVPGTLVDLLITLTLSGYHDPELRKAIDTAPRKSIAATLWLSGRATFPDEFYEFNHSGRMVWNVTRDLLTLTDTLGAVRNAAVLLLSTAATANHFGRVMSRYEIRVRITSTGNLEVLSEIPQVTFMLGDNANPLSLAAKVTLPASAEISWEFGDGSARQSGPSQQHTYAKPGQYTVSLRVVRNGRLSEFRADVVVSRSQAGRVSPPVTAFPEFTVDTGAGIPTGHTRVVGTVTGLANDPVITNWRLGEQEDMKGARVSFDLKAGDYTVFFTAVRVLKARVYCTQRYLTGPMFGFNGLSLASNRRFDPDGNEITGVGDNPAANPVAAHLFAPGALSPVDQWTVELPLADNDFLRTVDITDVEEYGLAEIQDMVLTLEYETTAVNL